MLQNAFFWYVLNISYVYVCVCVCHLLWFVTTLCHLNIRLRIDFWFLSMWIEFESNISCICSLLSVRALVMCVLFFPLFGVCFLCVHMREGWCVLLFVYIIYMLDFKIGKWWLVFKQYLKEMDILDQLLLQKFLELFSIFHFWTMPEWWDFERKCFQLCSNVSLSL